MFDRVGSLHAARWVVSVPPIRAYREQVAVTENCGNRGTSQEARDRGIIAGFRAWGRFEGGEFGRGLGCCHKPLSG